MKENINKKGCHVVAVLQTCLQYVMGVNDEKDYGCIWYKTGSCKNVSFSKRII